MLSSYNSDILAEYTRSHGWQTRNFTTMVSVNNTPGAAKKQKTEVLTMNYLPAIREQDLFSNG